MKNVFVYHWLYRVTVCVLLPIILGAIGFGGFICLQWLQGGRATIFSMAVCLFVLVGIVGLFFLFLAYVIKVVTWELRMEDEGLTVTYAWRRYSLPFREVKGYKLDGLGIFMKPHNRLFRPVSASFFIDDYSAFALWANERLGVHSQDVCNSRGRIFDNRLLGPTPKEAVSNYQKGILLYYLISVLGWPIGLFVLIVGHPVWLSSIIGLVLPLTCIWAIVHTGGLIEFYAKRDDTSFQPEFYRLVLFSCLVITLRLALDYNLFPVSMFWPIALCISLVVYLVLNRTVFYRAALKVSHAMQWIIMALCLMYGYWLTIVINCHLDTSLPNQQEVLVSSKKITSGLLPAPVIKLEFWNGGNSPSSNILTTLSQYQRVSPGDSVMISVHRGLLGIPWYRSRYSVFNEGELGLLGRNRRIVPDAPAAASIHQ